MATKTFYVQRGASLFHGGKIKTQGDAVEMTPEAAAPLVAKGTLGVEAPRSVPAPPPAPAHDRSEGEEEILAALGQLQERTTLLEKQVRALQESGVPGTLDEIELESGEGLAETIEALTKRLDDQAQTIAGQTERIQQQTARIEALHQERKSASEAAPAKTKGSK